MVGGHGGADNFEVTARRFGLGCLAALLPRALLIRSFDGTLDELLDPAARRATAT